MFELTVQREFCAAHAIMIGGRREPVHGHNWLVTLTVTGEKLDNNGLLCDFHLLERRLEEAIKEFDNNDLNSIEPFDRVNPTAERVAEHIGRQMALHLPFGVTLERLSVREAPGCTATYRP
jgi:6-pyruvoyltetrahydropterin/6-carboxytetrahydropterin synthase